MTTVLNLNPVIQLTREQFHSLCALNPDVFLERSQRGELIIASPTGGSSGNREAELIGELHHWNRQSKLGKVFSSSTMFALPEGGDRSPDVAWVKLECWQALTPEQQDGFLPICPDFAIELRSRTNRLKPLQEKMQEYLNSVLQLGWLIDHQNQQVEIYRPGCQVQIAKYPAVLSGEELLPGFTLRWPLSD